MNKKIREIIDEFQIFEVSDGNGGINKDQTLTAIEQEIKRCMGEDKPFPTFEEDRTGFGGARVLGGNQRAKNFYEAWNE